MSLIRGIRSISYGYTRDFASTPDSEENQALPLTLESADDCCHVKLANVWPHLILLNAAMAPAKITSSATVERIQDGRSFGKNAIYQSPLIYRLSSIKNPNSFCAGLILNFENFGEYNIDSQKNNFVGKIFEEYELKFAKADNVLFEKKFLTSTEGIIQERYVGKDSPFLLIDGTRDRAPCKIYPYGGFYEYGAHPRQVESCVFQISSGDSTSAIKISSLTTLKGNGVDPTKNTVMGDGTIFVGIDNFTPSQTMNLYDELKGGCCKIQLMNRITKKVCAYRSNGCAHVANTNLISICFIKEIS
jgi:hypothetical protein